MEDQIIKKIRINKNRLLKIYKKLSFYTDFSGSEMAGYDTLFMLYLLSKIDSELTDIIYMIIDNKNS